MPTLKDAAPAIGNLLQLDNLLAFPAVYVEQNARRLRCIAHYFKESVTPWEPEWGSDLRTVGLREVARIVARGLSGDGALFIASDVPDHDRAVVSRQVLLYETVTAVNFGCSMRFLWRQAVAGQEDGLHRLVQIDKTFLALPWCRGLIKRRAHQGDWQFFERLGRAISAPPLVHPAPMYAPLILTAAYWDEYFSSLSYPKTVEVLQEYGLLSRQGFDPRTFAQAVRRAGLKKERHSRYRVRQ